MKKSLKYAAVALVVALLSASIVISSISLNSQLKMSELINRNYGETEDINQEDDVVISNEYTIKSTLNISDAYKSGNASALDDSDKETLDMASDVLKNVIKDGMTPYEKEKAVYEYLVKDLQSTTGILTVIPAIEQENDNPHDVLKYKTAVCVGYATTFRMLMQMLDIDCKVIHSKQLYHSWNLVKLDDGWYHVDCFSDNGGTTYSNFNMNDTQCAASHEWTREYFPAANGKKYNYVMSVCEELKDIYKIPEWLCKAVKKRKSVISCTFKNKITDKNQYDAKRMTDSLCERMQNEDYGMEAQWSQNDNGDYVLSFYISYYTDEEDKVDEKTIEKIDDAINQAMDKYIWS